MVNMCGQISRGIGHNCPASLFQLVIAQMLDKTADLSVYETNRDILYRELTDMGFTCVKPGGTFYIFPKAMEEDAKIFCRKATILSLFRAIPSERRGISAWHTVSTLKR